MQNLGNATVSPSENTLVLPKQGLQAHSGTTTGIFRADSIGSVSMLYATILASRFWHYARI
jgi:hypothetical protein